MRNAIIFALFALILHFFVVVGRNNNTKVIIKEPDINGYTLDVAIKDNAGKIGIDPILLATIIEHESSFNPNAINYEPGHNELARKLCNKNCTTPDIKMLSSSLGLMQVMGWHSKEYNIHWKELLSPVKNIEIGTKILGKCIAKHKEIKRSIACYNGKGEKTFIYASNILAKYKKRVNNKNIG